MQNNQTLQLQELKQKRKGNPIENNLNSSTPDKQVIQAYERYILAQFTISPFTPDLEFTIEQERKQAIESLVPGSLHYYHLYFLDLSKKMSRFDDFDQNQKEQFQRFEINYGQSSEFSQIEIRFCLFNKLGHAGDGLQGYKDLVNYLMDYCVSQNFIPCQLQDFMQTQSSSHFETDSQSDTDNPKIDKITEEFLYDKYFSRGESLKQTQNKLNNILQISEKDEFKELSNEELGKLILKEQLQYVLKKKQWNDNNNKQSQETLDFVIGFEDELDWSQVPSKVVMYHALKMSTKNYQQINKDFGYMLYQMENESFLNKICDFFKEEVCLKNVQTVQQSDKKILKEICQQNPIFEGLTIQQLDFIRANLQNQNLAIWKAVPFVEAYFSKIFSEELSSDYQEQLSLQDKFDNLLKLYNFAKENDLPKSLKQNLLHEMLSLTIKLDDYKQDLFDDYLEHPIEHNSFLKKEQIQKYNQKGQQKHSLWNACLSNVSFNQIAKVQLRGWHIRDDDFDIIPKYLRQICIKNGGSLEKFADNFNLEYLQQIEKKVQVYLTDTGLLDLNINIQEYNYIQNEVILRLKETNVEKFKVEEAVVLKLEIKNITELVIRVYEFNTETYYKKNMLPFDSTIDLSGLEPSFTKKESERLKGQKKNKIISLDFTFEELKDKIGTFIIEFQGNGKMAKAVVKKGSLTLIDHATVQGFQAYIIDADRNVCIGEETGVWIDNKFYKADSKGAILIPYTKNQVNEAIKLIMIHNGFAQLGEFMRKAQVFNLDCFFHLNSESFLVGQEAKILVRPNLTVNGQKTSVKFLKKIKIILKIKDFDFKETKQTFNDLIFKDDEEYILSFQVPPNSCQISLQLSASRTNSKNQIQNFELPEKILLISEHKDSVQNLNEMYLRKIGQEFYLYILGRNGEPQVHQTKVNVKVYHKDFKNHGEQLMSLDKQGKVKLGYLNDVVQVKASMIKSNGQQEREESWAINHDSEDIWTLPQQIDIIHGESVELPVNWQKSDKLKPHQVSLLMSRNKVILNNMFKRIKLIDSPGKCFKMIRLDGLEVGKYVLNLRLNAGQHQSINITVHRGTYWQGNFILKNNCLYESNVQKQIISFQDLNLISHKQNKESDGTSSQQTILKLQLQNYSQKSRVHVFATQFIPNCAKTLMNELQQFVEAKSQGTRFPFAIWKNIYESDHVLSDEIRYIYNRRNQQPQMGNNLDQPSLLMKKTFVRNTTSIQENLNKGTTYGSKVLDDKTSQSQTKAQDKYQFSKGIISASQEINCNKIKDYQNFLAYSPLQLFNLKPDEHGQVIITLQDISNYQQLYFVACDEGSVVQRQISTQQICETDQTISVPVIPKRDLSQDKKSLDNSEEKGLIEERCTDCLFPGDRIHIEDITSSKLQLIDDMALVVKVVEMNPIYDFRNHEVDDKLLKLTNEVLLPWHSFDNETKIKKFQLHISHELNVFLFKKDKDFFKKVVLVHVINKLEKTFVDYYLIASSDKSEFVNQLVQDQCKKQIIEIMNFRPKFMQLNPFEICLGLEFAQSNLQKNQKIKKMTKYLIQSLSEKQGQLDNKQIFIDQKVNMFDIILNLEDLDRKTYFDKFENHEPNELGLSTDNGIDVSNNFGSNPFSNHEANNQTQILGQGATSQGLSFGGFGSAPGSQPTIGFGSTFFGETPSGFGAPTSSSSNIQPQTASFGSMGPSSGLFGSGPGSQPTSGFGLFGAPTSSSSNIQPQSASFGATPQGLSFGAFGSGPGSQPTSGFGSTLFGEAPNAFGAPQNIQLDHFSARNNVLFGGPPIQQQQNQSQASSNPFGNPNRSFGFGSSIQQNVMPMSQNIMAVQNVMPMAQQNVMPMRQNIMVQQNVMPMAQVITSVPQPITSFDQNYNQQTQNTNNQYYPTLHLKNNLYDDLEGEYQNYKKTKKKDQLGFQELENTKEYIETHYYGSPSSGPFPDRFKENSFYLDYLQYLQSNENLGDKQLTSGFLTNKICDISLSWLPAALTFLDLPFSRNQVQEKHKFRSDNKRGIFMTAGSNAIVFKKEIKDGECKIKSDIIIIHRYESKIDYLGKEVQLDEFVVNHPYQCEVIMTNVSVDPKQVRLLYQIPNGSLPLQKTKYIDSCMLQIEPYTTTKKTIQFYFPASGNFVHHSSCVSENQNSTIVVAKSEIKQIEVGKKRIIKKAENFKDIMLMIRKENLKKQKIIELFEQSQESMLFDSNFGFKIDYILPFCTTDFDFFLKICKIYDEIGIIPKQLLQLVLQNIKSILENEKYASETKFILFLFKEALFDKCVVGNQRRDIYSYIAYELPENQLLYTDTTSLFNEQYKHLEYSPVVNQRVFSIAENQINFDFQEDGANQKLGQSQKEIQNIQLRETYIKFLQILLQQNLLFDNQKDGQPLDLPIKLKLQLTYYLQIQGRINESLLVFKSINCNQQENSKHCLSKDLIVFDYMKAYFDFYGADEESEDQIPNKQRFSAAREIIQKYKNTQITEFKKAFNKIKDQLEELDKLYDEFTKSNVEPSINDQTEDQKMILPKNRGTNPCFKDIDLDDRTGELKIETENLTQISVKYYLIDTEILFSRSPFLQDQAEKFSYVKPFIEIKKDVNQSVYQTIIPLPQSLVGKNVVIEINSQEIQKFKTFYSSQILVNIEEEYGELHAFNKQTMRPMGKVYVKVFCKKNDGQELFYRDGFTDIRGKFEYAQASGKKVSDIDKFSIFLSYKESEVIKEAKVPKNKS